MIKGRLRNISYFSSVSRLGFFLVLLGLTLSLLKIKFGLFVWALAPLIILILLSISFWKDMGWWNIFTFLIILNLLLSALLR